MNANKRILSIVLALVLCLSSAAISVSALDYPDTENAEYKEIVFEALDWELDPLYYDYFCVYKYNADGSMPEEGETPDYILAFANHTGVVHDMVLNVQIGDYSLTSGCSYYPYDLGYFIYSFEENKCYSLEEAWEAELPQTEEVLKYLTTEKYQQEVFDLLGWEIGATDPYSGVPLYAYSLCYEYNADGSQVRIGATADYALVFIHTGGILCWELRETFGNYQLNNCSVYYPYIAGYVIYSTAENKIYSLHEAYYHRLPNMENVLKQIGTKVSLYAQPFEEYFKSEIPEENIEIIDIGWYDYREHYYYMGKNGGTTEMPEATPDYVLVDAAALGGEYGYAYGVYGDYVVKSRLGNPDTLMYYIYTPCDGRIYTLREAYEAGVQGIENVFTDYGLGMLLGDADSDDRLTVKDATYIQKYLVKTRNLQLPKDIVGVNDGDDTSPDTEKFNIADFDQNDKINIKDATAIQKRLAKIAD